ncbi:MAG: ATP-binding cassette domain-containing protein [Rhodospirillales bacterium]|nr:ATP-binding cassette domain-containing protein [Rhodospirillales bacterium]
MDIQEAAKPDIRPEVGPKPNEAGSEIRIEGLKKAFGDHRVLDGVDLDIRRGDIVAIVGGSGCGKTVLLNHILGELIPDAGSVRVVDYRKPDEPLVDIATLDDHEFDLIQTRWGVVFQRNALFSGTVYDNIELWLKEVRDLDDEEIEAIAERVLAAVALPEGAEFLHTTIESLSGGMAKRLAIARAISMEPKVIFYDEPTTGLDPTSAAQIQDLVFATHHEGAPAPPGRTTVIITHDKDLLNRLHPRIVLLHDGRVAFDGPFAEFEASDTPVIRPYFDLMPVLHRRPAPSA